MEQWVERSYYRIDHGSMGPQKDNAELAEEATAEG